MIRDIESSIGKKAWKFYPKFDISRLSCLILTTHFLSLLTMSCWSDYLLSYARANSFIDQWDYWRPKERRVAHLGPYPVLLIKVMQNANWVPGRPIPAGSHKFSISAYIRLVLVLACLIQCKLVTLGLVQNEIRNWVRISDTGRSLSK